MLLIFSDWEQRKLEELAEFFNEKRIPIDSSKREVGKYPYYGATGIIDYVKNYIFDGEFVLLAEDGANITMRNSPIAYLTKGKFWLNNHAHILKMKKGSNKFLLQMLENQNYEKFNSGTAQPKLNAQVVKEMRFFFPREQEQIKIGIFFKRLDDTIALHQDKLEKLKQLKKGYLQFMFPQNGEKVPRLRFANFLGDWEQRELSEIVERITRKNKNLESTLPLTISAQGGLINQNDFFNKQVASRDVSNYYLVKKGDFAYNKSYSNGYPWGAVKRLDSYDMGVLSTLYIVFIPTRINSNFLVSYYDTTSWHKEVSKRAAEGARNHGLLNITASDFFKTKLSIPSSGDEQEKIGNFFRQFDDNIALQNARVMKLKKLFI